MCGIMNQLLRLAMLSMSSNKQASSGVKLAVQDTTLKLQDYSTPAWRRSHFNKAAASFWGRKVLSFLKLAWKQAKIKDSLVIRFYPTTHGSLTVSRGPVARKKQSRDQYSWRSAGWWLKLPCLGLAHPISEMGSLSSMELFTALITLTRSPSITRLFDTNVVSALSVRHRFSAPAFWQFRL